MKRRGFLGLMGGAVAAGPAMAKQAVAGIEAMALPSSFNAASGGILLGGEKSFSTMATAVGDTYNHGDWLRDRIAEITGLSAEDRRERINNMHIGMLDPDLAVNRSMALWVKVAEQKRRDFERAQDRELRSWTKELARWLKDQARS